MGFYPTLGQWYHIAYSPPISTKFINFPYFHKTYKCSPYLRSFVPRILTMMHSCFTLTGRLCSYSMCIIVYGTEDLKLIATFKVTPTPLAIVWLSAVALWSSVSLVEVRLSPIYRRTMFSLLKDKQTVWLTWQSCRCSTDRIKRRKRRPTALGHWNGLYSRHMDFIICYQCSMLNNGHC